MNLPGCNKIDLEVRPLVLKNAINELRAEVVSKGKPVDQILSQLMAPGKEAGPRGFQHRNID